MEKKDKIILIVIALFMVLTIIGYNINKKIQYDKSVTNINQLETANKNIQNALKTIFKDKIKYDISQDKNGNFIGYVYNNSTQDVRDITIKISFYDGGNAKLGEQIIIINGLNHDEKYKVNEILWSKYNSAKTWKITDENVMFTDSNYN